MKKRMKVFIKVKDQMNNRDRTSSVLHTALCEQKLKLKNNSILKGSSPSCRLPQASPFLLPPHCGQEIIIPVMVPVIARVMVPATAMGIVPGTAPAMVTAMATGVAPFILARRGFISILADVAVTK